MRLIFTALLGLAVGVTLSCCRSPQSPAPSQPQAPSPAVAADKVQSIEFFEHGTCVPAVSCTRFTRTAEGTLVHLWLYYEDEYETTESPELMERAEAILSTYNVRSWNEFSGCDPNVLDGSSFYLEVIYTDGTRLEARGCNSFPENYRAVMSALNELAAPIAEQAAI